MTTEAALAPYLRGQAAEFLRSLRLHHEHSAPADSGGHDAAAATRAGGPPGAPRPRGPPPPPAPPPPPRAR
ncbi:hypothetical protein ACFWJY_34370, partial [Streptomyces anulatus]